MTKLSLVPLNHEIKNSSSTLLHKLDSNKIEANADDSSRIPTDILVGPKHSEVVKDSHYESNEKGMLCIEDEEEMSLEIINKNSDSSKINGRVAHLSYTPLWGVSSVCGRRKEMEDTVVALPSFIRIPSSMLCDGSQFGSVDRDFVAHLFGVYDGHGGCEVANYCHDRLHLALAEEIGIARENWLNEHNWEAQWLKIFLKCFHKMDDEVGGYPEVNGDNDLTPLFPPVAADSVGSTALVAIVCSTHIIVANCGDSRAVLSRGKVPMPLSVDHKPNSKDECTRIEAAGGKVIYWNGYRVSGFLAVSRSIGDRYLRPYVIADPDIMFVPRAKEDECLILASDGLWDVMTNEEACNLARKRILLWHKKNGPVSSNERVDLDPAAQDAANYLSRVALGRGSIDNISVIVVDLKGDRKSRKKKKKN